MVLDLDADEVGFLEDIEEKVRHDEQLWDLDERLAAPIPPGT
ncbi:hypothetical protein Mal4_49840 [Maioricimonas rarisocia]|uniref:Uncharacterized protein n=1 Tax=Maioricimonas rarisocia TaxID=2528026 RepID=A0A517ZDR9_9PLAN|nr:hypothetical protein Mal4_49840 [Maioricimonas rarisocia]